MEKRTLIILITILILAFVFLLGTAVFVVKKKGYQGWGNNAGDSPEIGGGQPPFFHTEKINSPTAKVLENDYTDNIKYIKGTVKSVSGDEIKVEADIVDFSKLTADSYKDQSNLPTMKKTYTVKTSSSTKFSVNKPKDIQPGQYIRIEAEELVYKNDTLTAVKVVCFTPSKKE